MTLGLDGPEWEAIRLQVLERDHYTCQFCGNTNDVDLVVHHRTPRRQGGTD